MINEIRTPGAHLAGAAVKGQLLNQEPGGGKNQGGIHHGSSINETASGGRRPFWASDQKMESENGGVYFHRAQWNLYH